MRGTRTQTLLALCLLATLAIGPRSAAATTSERYFAETGHSVVSKFLAYWDAHGGLAQFGYPISDEFQEISNPYRQTYTVQYFERAEFKNQTPYDVELAQLGTFSYNSEYPQPPETASNDNPLYFPATGKTIGGKFLTYWEQHGGLEQQGYPITDEFSEVSVLNGKTYTAQYFERAEFEYHPENQPPYDVLLSQLGTYRYADYYLNLVQPSTDTVVSLSMTSANEGWVLGAGGTILHYTNHQWVAVSNPLRNNYVSYSGIAMVSSDEGWIVGGAGFSGGVLLHYSQGRWQYYEHQVPMDLYRIDMLSANEGWSVGYNGASSAGLHYKDGTWSVEGASAPLVLDSISMDSANDGWAGGLFYIAHCTNGEWQTERLPGEEGLAEIKMISASSGWAVGNVILHYTGGEWQQATKPVSTELAGLYLEDGNNGWAVGDKGTILHLSSGSWSQYPSPTDKTLYAVQMVSADEGWAVGDRTILHYQNGTWRVYQWGQG